MKTDIDERVELHEAAVAYAERPTGNNLKRLQYAAQDYAQARKNVKNIGRCTMT